MFELCCEDTVCRYLFIDKDEKYTLNDIIQFRISMEALPPSDHKLTIKFTLLYSPLHSYTGKWDKEHAQESVSVRV